MNLKLNEERSEILKKIIISLLLLIILSSCSNNQEHKQYTILFATPLEEHQIWKEAEKGFFAACEVYNVNCEWKGPIAIDTQIMNDTIETGIMKRVNGIITQGVVDPVLIEKANEKDIPIVLVDSDMENTSRISYLGKNFHQQAELILSDVEKKYGKQKKLNIAIQVADASFNIAKAQIKEIESVFSDHKGGYEIVNISQSGSDSVRAKKEWEIALKEQQDVNLSISFAAESSVFCAEAANELGLQDDMLIYGVDDLENTLIGIKKGDIDGTIVTSFYDYGYQGVKTIVDYLNAGEVPEYKNPMIELINKDNIEAYEEK